VTVLVLGVLAAVAVRAQGQAQATKSDVMASVTAAETNFKQAKASLEGGDFTTAHQQFQLAQGALHHANQALASRGQLGGLSGSQVGGELSSGSQLLTNAELLAQSATKIAADLQAMRDGLATQGNDLMKAGEVITSRLKEVQKDVKEANERLALMEYAVSGGRRDVTQGELKPVLDKLHDALPAARDQAAQAEDVLAILPSFFGQDHFKQYLLWFQNPNELRATGGFVGTYGRLTLDNGAVKELSVDSIYNPANQVNVRIKDRAPAPYSLFYGSAAAPPVWALQDANWSADFPTSAQRFQRYYELSGGPTTDGVIAVNVFPIIETLRILGPIEMPEYDYTLDADNFTSLIQSDQQAKSVEGDADPKKILRDFVPKLLARIGQATPDEQRRVIQVFSEAGKKRNIFAYFTNPRLEGLAESAGIDGKLTNEPTMLSVVDTNIAGYKSSQDVQSTLVERVEITERGEMLVTANLNRRYVPTVEAPAVNQNFTRFIVPPGTSVQETAGFLTEAPYVPVSVSEEDGHTIAGGWTTVDPGAQRTVSVRYRLPRKLDLGDGKYQFVYRKQGGTAFQLEAEVTLPEGYAWEPADGWTIKDRTISATPVATTDRTAELRFRKQ